MPRLLKNATSKSLRQMWNGFHSSSTSSSSLAKGNCPTVLKSARLDNANNHTAVPIQQLPKQSAQEKLMVTRDPYS